MDIARGGTELAVTIGLIEATMKMGPFQWPDEVQENFHGKVENLYHNLQRELAEFVEFGRALDNAEDEG